eukprot:gnl/TRDRNA2_/TRDRNA2_40788_c0_seq1.p1 gnl/TRDRNA2_/TRDRNA2_40788_c0~~gnl/TRDRNA2_/TRDRNA2_40788_c0_seq1.p1  ORF type:complete len:499 (+),score=83.48 gnl/TRDRNA2_/TRDRNA2_40788_c0_seq1:352-1848(+)
MAALESGSVDGSHAAFGGLLMKLMQMPAAWGNIVDILDPTKPWTSSYCDKINAMMFVNVFGAFDFTELRLKPPDDVLNFIRFVMENMAGTQAENQEAKRLHALLEEEGPAGLSSSMAMHRLFVELYAKLPRHILRKACKGNPTSQAAFAKRDSQGRTTLHLAAQHGNTPVVAALLEDLELPPANRSDYIAALDSDGYSAQDYAHLGHFQETAAKIAQAAGASSTPKMPVTLFPSPPATSSETTERGSGGWDMSDMGAVPEEWMPPADNSCFADVIDVSQFDDGIFHKHYFTHGRPLLIRNGASMPDDVAEYYTREGLLELAGEHEVNAYLLPYADKYRGDKPMKKSLHDYAAFLKTRASAKPADALHYVFLIVPPRNHNLSFVHTLPSLLTQKVQVGQAQFYLGGVLMGSQMHFHNAAFNSLVHGRKLWYVRPPANQMFVNEVMYDHISRGAHKGALTCVQEAGDLFYVPADWSHGTICLSDCIGVGHEFFNFRYRAT